MTDRTDIRPLDQSTVERIAAGEVVERPASAVKELVENSLDADASRVTVAVEAGGIDGLRVRDDGHGMTETDVRAAVEEHTTSKIRDVEDLDSGVSTLGFRGEALHTIGAVSRMTIRTRPRGGDDVGTELVYEGGEVQSVDPVGCPEGTTIEVENLFFNTPARKKYLKREATEFAHVNRVVTQYALANPDVAVSLTHDGRETFATTGQGGRRGTVLSVYGRSVAESMIGVDATENADDGPLDGVTGLVSHPETNRASTEYLSAFVNGRYVRSPAVRDAVVDAYGGQLAGDRYPFAVLYLSLPPGEVDVNVHPRKMEVRFGDESGVKRQVRNAVEAALLDHGLVRSSAPRGRSKASETAVAPESTEVQDEGGAPRDGHEPTAVRDTTAAGSSPLEATEGATNRSTGASVDGERDSESRDSGESNGPGEKAYSRPSRKDRGRTARLEADRKFSTGGEQATLGGGTVDDAPEFESLPSLRVLGQLHDTYVVCETDDGLALVDQHAADERINYERLREAFADGVTAQALADPVEVDLTAGEAATFDAYREALTSLGFRAEAVDDRTVRVDAVPAVFRKTLDPEDLRDVLGEFLLTEAGDGTVADLADEFIADLACYPSITGNTSLTEGSVLDLLRALDDCENPFACPHGRPVVVAFDETEIGDRFERDYPGHG